MLETNRYSVINIRRYLNSDNPKLGESRLLQVLSGFSCPRNPDVERFLKKSSIEFTKKNQSVTYLIFDINSMVLVGYFTLALKPLTVKGETVSNTVRKSCCVSVNGMKNQIHIPCPHTLLPNLAKILPMVQTKKLLVKNYSYWHGTKLKRYSIWAEA